MDLTRETKEAYVSVQKNLFKLCICFTRIYHYIIDLKAINFTKQDSSTGVM